MSKKLKKSKINTIPKEKSAKVKLITDTTCLGLRKISWEEVYNLLEDKNSTMTKEKVTVPVQDLESEDNPLKELADSYLHRVAARANIFPYYDLV